MRLACFRRALAVLALVIMAAGGARVAWAQPVLWSELKPSQQTALAPLAAEWPLLSEEQQRNWMAVSRRYPRMTPGERQILQDRMTEWAELSPKDRNQARFNFNAIKSSLSAAQRRAKWEEYRALPEAEKERLARNRRVPRGASPALRPPLPGQLVRPPPQPTGLQSVVTTLPPRGVYNAPRYIRRVIIPADRNTLLPKAMLDEDNNASRRVHAPPPGPDGL